LADRAPIRRWRSATASARPLYHAERLSKLVIFFQGEEDEVVPPNQSEAMVEVLRRKA
jgi:dipeptidyl aminopeptidase/acylaminoacyl peptidase